MLFMIMLRIWKMIHNTKKKQRQRAIQRIVDRMVEIEGDEPISAGGYHDAKRLEDDNKD